MTRICPLCNENDPDIYNICDVCFYAAGEIAEENPALHAAAPQLLKRARALLDNWESGNLGPHIQALAEAVAEAEGR